jgi:hypothetical protein
MGTIFNSENPLKISQGKSSKRRWKLLMSLFVSLLCTQNVTELQKKILLMHHGCGFHSVQLYDVSNWKEIRNLEL